MWRKLSKAAKTAPSDGRESTLPAPPKYPKPKIMLVDCRDDEERALKLRGFNVLAGTYGKPYSVEKAHGFVPVLWSAALPNFAEQEVLIVDLATRDPAPQPVGEKRTPKEDPDLWASSKVGLVDPRPGAMSVYADWTQRILRNGGAFVLFAGRVSEQELVLGSMDAYGRFDISERIHYNNWSCLPDLNQLEVDFDRGTEIAVPSLSHPLMRLVAAHLQGASFECTVGPAVAAQSQWQILARNKFGIPVGAACLSRKDKGVIIVLPQLRDKPVFLVRLLEEVLPGISPHLFPHVSEGKWVHRPQYELPKVVELEAGIAEVIERAEKEKCTLEAAIAEERMAREFLYQLLTGQGDVLVQAVTKALRTLGFETLVDVDEERDRQGQSRREDLQILDKSPTLIVDVKGVDGLPSDADALQSQKHASIRMSEWKRTDIAALTIVNHQHHLPPLDRQNKMPFRQEILDDADISHLGLMTTWDLYRLVRSFQKNDWKAKHVKPVFYRTGRIDIVPCHYRFVGCVGQLWKPAFAVEIQQGELQVGDRIALELENEYLELDVASLKVNDRGVDKVVAGALAGVATNPHHPQLKTGMRVFRIGEDAAPLAEDRDS